ncbi:CBL-interacting serine/threonine-protein kinase 21-like protein [Cinnamomum micranthum f. kanehirae]|uniref:non-specific serine/threonine protein kinase n=1 Tax=Cinnamomum micranthum f. kanehirae TaxID=337451 RepID=A0A3S3N336_9MAGN|nr:CBL-interacting serine/threonine-protein kinase 21-like protein [Cinnamomum micranthum f. kanehirae]
MGCAANIGKYRLVRTVGEGSFAKVKAAVNTETGQSAAIKIIDKQMVMDNKLMEQVKREISTMKLLCHPNIVRIYEVIATKTKIYLVMEYVSGGPLTEKLSYLKRLSEGEARKFFQQLIDAVEYCHCRGVYHRDLKPENLLIDSKGNLKVSDFGLSTLHKPGDLLATACGSPSYVAPEVISKNKYNGSAADVWSCGVILFEMLAGYLPFNDQNLMNLYRKISRAEYTCPEWFSASQRKLIFRILEPVPTWRMTVAEIIEDKWFKIDYQPSTGTDHEKSVNLDAFNAAFDGMVVRTSGSTTNMDKAPSQSFINAFQLIAMSSDLDLSGLFEEQDDTKQKMRLGSKHSIHETIEKIEVAAKFVRLSVERMNNSKVKLLGSRELTRSKHQLTVSAEVIEVTPAHCMVEITQSNGELWVYKEFCKSLSSVLEENPRGSTMLHLSSTAKRVNGKDIQQNGSSKEEETNRDTKEFLRGYSSS